MLRKVVSLIIFFLLMAGGTTQAQVAITYSSQGTEHFSMTIPDNWRINVGSELAPNETQEGEKTVSRLITAVPGDHTPLWFGIWVPADVNDFKEAKEYLDALGIDILTDVVTTKRTFDTINEMEVYFAGGTGKKEGETMDFRAAFVQLSKKSVAIAIYIGPHETTITHGDDLLRMFHSLQAIKNTPGE